MLLPTAKLIICIGASSALAAGAYGVVYLADNSMRSLYDNGEYSGDDSSDKFGDEFSYYFLATKDKTNVKIWEARAKTLRNNTPEGNEELFFTDIKQNASAATLKEKCKQKYDENFPTEKHRQRWKGVWIYCSIGGMRPKTIEESKTYEREYKSTEGTENQPLGKVLKLKLISTKDPDNKWFWNIRQREFKAGRIRKTQKSTSAYFSTNTTETLQRLCERAYEMKISDDATATSTSPSKDEVEKYCGIRKVETSQQETN